MCVFWKTCFQVLSVRRQSSLDHSFEGGLGILRLEWRTGFSKVENLMPNKTKWFKRTFDDSIIDIGPTTFEDMEMGFFEHVNYTGEWVALGLCTRGVWSQL